MEELRQERERRTRLQELVSNETVEAAPKTDGPKENGDGAEPARTTGKTDAATLPADAAAQQLAAARLAMDELLKKYGRSTRMWCACGGASPNWKKRWPPVPATELAER